MKKLIIPIVLLVAAGALIGYKMYNKEHADTASLDAKYKLKAGELISEYEEDEAAADAKYLDKVVSIAGVVKSVEKGENHTAIVLDGENGMSNIICQLEKTDISLPKEGEKVTVKGICTGYLMDVVLVRSVVE